MKSAVSITDLKKQYRSSRFGEGKLALKGVSLEIPKGSMFGLLGPNGAGKSTLINILAGLSVKTSGKVIVEGCDQDDDPVKTRSFIGVVPQEVVLDPFFTVTETLDYYAGYYGVPKADRRTKELIDALSLSDKANVNSRRLSGGMKRRVLIAKALVHNPPIVILDEPTAGVDVELRSQLWEYVRELNARGVTILLTTHYLEEAQELCDNIAIINHGEIIANAPTQELMRALDQKCLTIQVEETLEKVPAAFVGVNASLSDPHTLTISYNREQVGINALLDFTKKANLTIKDLSTEESDLEDVFRHLVANVNNEEKKALS